LGALSCVALFEPATRPFSEGHWEPQHRKSQAAVTTRARRCDETEMITDHANRGHSSPVKIGRAGFSSYFFPGFGEAGLGSGNRVSRNGRESQILTVLSELAVTIRVPSALNDAALT
jgi:hypothetical protein